MSIIPIKDALARNAGATDYDKLWKKLKEHREDDLPRQVLTDAEDIYNQARRDKDFAQLLKAWIVITETRSDIDPEDFHPTDIQTMPHQGAVQTAIYNAVLASAYLAMTDTAISDNDEDTKTDYSQLADSLFVASLSDREALYAESALAYKPLIQVGEDSRFYHHDLLSLLADFALEHSRMTQGQKASLTAELADFYLAKGNREATLLRQLQHLTYLNRHEDYNLRLHNKEYADSLKSLLDKARNTEPYADVAQAYGDEIADADEKADFCRQVLRDCPEAYNANYFKRYLHDYLRPNLTLSFPDVILADKPIQATLRYENLTEASFSVRLFNGYKDKWENQPKLDGKLILNQNFALGTDSLNADRLDKGYSTRGEQSYEFTLPAGRYVFITDGAEEQSIRVASITSLCVIAFRLPNDKTKVLVRNNETGRPVTNAIVCLQDNRGNDLQQQPCDQEGCVVFDSDKLQSQVYAFIPGTEDRSQPVAFGYTPSSVGSGTKTEVRLFTDRAIYRPGQTVHLAGISFSQQGDQTWTNPARSLTVTLRDANGQTVSEQTVKTNVLGSFDADFSLPTGLLPGQFSIRCDRGSVAFRVEEYKRPTFTVEARNTATKGQTFTFGDTLQVEALAKTYAGVPVQGATAHYCVESAQVSFWRWWDNDWELLTEGDLSTDDDGLARIPVFLDPQELSESSYGLVSYRVTFDVTDQAGETHSDSYEFSLSRRTFALQVQAPSVLDVANPEQQIIVNAINANHEKVACSGSYHLYAVGNEQPIATGDFQAGQPIGLPSLLTGDYHIKAVATDRDGTEITAEASFSLFDSRQPKAAARFSNDFLHVSRSTFGEGQDAEVFFAPSEGDAFVSYLLFSNDRLVESRDLLLDHQILRLRFAYRPEYGDGVRLYIYYVRNGHLFSQNYTFTYVRPEKQLKLSWSTFRDRLYPGQDETWTLSITNPQGKPVSGAELLATMYDASLDALSPHDWNFILYFPRDIRRFSFCTSPAQNHFYSMYVQGPYFRGTYQARSYDQLTEFVHDRWARQAKQFRSKHMVFSAPVMRSMAVAVEEEANDALCEVMVVNNEKPALVGSMMAEAESAEAAAPEQAKPEVGLRSNFAETAFFQPHLLSDDQGQVRISFTLPESLTEWQFMALAHDRDVNYGMLKAKAVARKDFMVQPNLPRFVREGDHATVSARVINQCESAIEGTVLMRLLDAETEDVVFTAEQAMNVEAGRTTSVTFGFEADDRHPMLICEVIGHAGQSSDGERNYLPVLSSRRYMTEAVPFYVMADDTTKAIDVHELFNNNSPTATHKRLILEYTQHPEWTVIEALDGIKLPEQDNAPGFAASLYANVTASRLAQSIPGFQEALSSQPSSATPQSSLTNSFSSLVESPWVNDALREADQRNRLIDLFDQDMMQQRTDKALQRLHRLQNADGSWSWFEGMSGSYYITLSTCENLIALCADNDEIRQMVTHALQYLDRKEYEDYQAQRRISKTIHVGEGTLHYLYVCAMMPDRKVSRDVEKMRAEMLKQLGKSVRNLTILGRAQAACILRSFGRTKEADKFLQSAVEYTVTKPGMGRFYATDIAYYSWRDYRIPTQLAAMRALRASNRADRQELLREMQIWLLRQKQTQMWDNPFNTIAAVQFLLEQGGVGATTDLPHFSLDGQAVSADIDTTRFLAEQLGYIRTQLSSEVIEHGVNTLQVTPTPAEDKAPASAIAWGALYAQYMEEMDRLDNHTTGELSITTHLLDADGEPLDPASLHVGQRVTLRLSIRADRDMDFVQVQCQRAACLEPVQQLSGYRWMNGRGGYVAQHDASTDVFFDRFTRGTTTFDLHFVVDRPGEYLSGIATVQCAYAPEFCAHSKALNLTVK